MPKIPQSARPSTWNIDFLHRTPSMDGPLDIAFRHALRRAASSLTRLRPRLPILIYHRVLEDPDPMRPEAMDAALFARQIAFIASSFRILPLSEAIGLLEDGRLPPRALSITVDDGYEECATLMLPILQSYGVTATFFVATGPLDGEPIWNDRIIEALRVAPDESLDLRDHGLADYDLSGVAQRAKSARQLIERLKRLPAWTRRKVVEEITARVPQDAMPRMLSREQIRTLYQAAMGIGSHTRTRPILTRIPPEDAQREIQAGKRTLEEIIGAEVDLFAYPNGDYTMEHIEMARQLGIRAAVSTFPGAAAPDTDRYQLPRFTPWDTQTAKFGLRLLWNQFAPVKCRQAAQPPVVHLGPQ